MGEIVYVLCALTSLACAVLLVRSYLASRSPLLFWSSVCFVGLFANNVLLVVDVVLTRDEVDLLLARDLTNLASVAALVFGLVWRAR
ncbi:MAG: hypothetical protein KIS78_27715 [Labilithrix sp.]|nr:hypothetical protein [Labilithrix sp.]MCW5836219.1 hypothetical protein [Labilithrix sp.]